MYLNQKQTCFIVYMLSQQTTQLTLRRWLTRWRNRLSLESLKVQTRVKLVYCMFLFYCGNRTLVKASKNTLTDRSRHRTSSKDAMCVRNCAKMSSGWEPPESILNASDTQPTTRCSNSSFCLRSGIVFVYLRLYWHNWNWMSCNIKTRECLSFQRGNNSI